MAGKAEIFSQGTWCVTPSRAPEKRLMVPVVRLHP